MKELNKIYNEDCLVGRNFIGFETDVNYFNIANERIKQRRIQEEQCCLF